MENEKQLPDWLRPPPCSHVNMRLRGSILFLLIAIVFTLYILISQEGAITKIIAASALVLGGVYLGYTIFNLPKCVERPRSSSGGIAQDEDVIPTSNGGGGGGGAGGASAAAVST